MSVKSMTGFGKAQVDGEKFTVTVELKTVNNRFKDFRFKMGQVFNALEIPLKKKLEKVFKRGSFEVSVNYKKNQKLNTEFELDHNKVEAFINDVKSISKKTDVAMKINPTDFLRSDFQAEDENKEEELKVLMLKAFDEALEALKGSREDEGKSLVTKLLEHKSEYAKSYANVIELKGSYQDGVREKLTKKFESELAGTKIDESRFMQEVIYYMEKLDIDEEITRINIHLKKLDEILNSSGEVGRQIDFLIQELNRETNTIGSKSGSSEISTNVVQMKVQLEKIREQALNME
jgi:uncharacterized protein (TIGR00255 family)